jgi:hypothetical protein
MIQISDLLKVEKPKIDIMSKKMVISFISEKVKINENKLKNWRIIAKLLKGLTNEEATRVYRLCEKGTWNNSADFSGAFFHEVKGISKSRVKKPKQTKLWK